MLYIKVWAVDVSGVEGSSTRNETSRKPSSRINIRRKLGTSW